MSFFVASVETLKRRQTQPLILACLQLHVLLRRIGVTTRFLRIARLGCLRNLKIVKNNTGDLIVEITDRLAIDGLEMLL